MTLRVAATAIFLLLGFSCASVKKATPELSEMEGKRVALVEVEGEETSRKVVEVSLVNQLVKNGTFILTSKAELQKAKDAHDLAPTDWRELTKRVNADYALRARILEFDAEVNEGYNTEEINDSQLEAERGDGRSSRVFKAKRMEGRVRVELTFVRIFDEDTRVGIAEAKEELLEEAKTQAIHLPPKLRFLENLANKAFQEFFDRYH